MSTEVQVSFPSGTGGIFRDIEGEYEVVGYDDVKDLTSAAIPSPDSNQSSSRVSTDTVIKDASSLTTSADLLGCRLELKWSSGRWYRGTICEYNAAAQKHKVLYDDGDIRWYFLPEMVYRFVREEDEWIIYPEGNDGETH